MKRKISYILPLLCSVLTVIAVTSCRQAPINGKLDGQWQVMTIEHLTEGRTETPHVATYIDLNLHVVNLRRNSAGGAVAGNMNYDKTASTVSMDFPYNQDSDGFLALRMWGIYTNPVVFEIIKLDGKQLVMRSPASIVTCRRF